MIVTIQRIQIRAQLRRCTDITERQRNGVLTVIVAGLAAVGRNGKIARKEKDQDYDRSYRRKLLRCNSCNTLLTHQ